ncbi:rubredoxin [Pseudomonas sp.]|uniref:rubredoxin n=1 Tax=Pseudomonas sp. TaxID=306 RepID=UPI0035652484
MPTPNPSRSAARRKTWPDEGIAAGTPWSEVPDDWLCPDCGVGKADFEMQER